MNLENELEKIGLEKREAKIYLVALEFGPINIQNLAKKSAIKRTTAYEVIKNLKDTGLLSEIIKGKRKLIVATSPDKFKKDAKEKERLISRILPELKSIDNSSLIKPKITFYEGRNELREIWKNTLKTESKLSYWISPIKSINETVGEEFLNNYVEERSQLGIWVKSIHITSKKESYAYIEPQFHKKTLRRMRFTPAEIDISDTIAIWDNKVAIMSSKKEGFGFVVESEDYANAMKVFHELLWNISKPWHEMNFDGKNKTEEKIEQEKDDDLDYWAKQ